MSSGFGWVFCCGPFDGHNNFVLDLNCMLIITSILSDLRLHLAHESQSFLFSSNNLLVQNESTIQDHRVLYI